MREVRRRIRTPAGLPCSSRCVAYVLRPPLFGQLAAQLAQLLQRRVVRLKVRDDGLDHADLGIPGTRLSAFHPVAGFPVVGAKQRDGLFAQLRNALVPQLLEVRVELLGAHRRAAKRKRVVLRRRGGELPTLVHLVLDEFASIGRLPDFERTIAAVLSRNIDVSVVLQSLAQLKSAYGDETVSTRTHNETRGASPGSSSCQTAERDLIQASEVGRLDRRRAIVFVAGADPVCDLKYAAERHPRHGELGSGLDVWTLVKGRRSP